MPVPTAISALSQTAASNSPATTESPTSADDYLRQYSAFIAMLRDGIGFTDPVQLASGATTSIGAQNSLFVEITGTTTITSFGTSYEGPRFLRFSGALTLTHNATTLNLPGGANITTEAGDTCIAIPNTTLNGWNVVQYQRATGQTLLLSDFLNTTSIDVASASTINLTSSAPNTRNINITGTTTITAFTVAVGRLYFVRFAGVLTLTNNANINTQTGANIITAAGDTCIIRAVSTNTVEVLCYVRNGPTVSASETVSGVVELANSAEAAAGTDATKAITPSSLFGGLNASGTAPIYAARAWVNFNGTGTVAIRASGNVSSITDVALGQYTVNFTNAMPDANYGFSVSAGTPSANTAAYAHLRNGAAPTTTTLGVDVITDGGARQDATYVAVAIFR